MEIQALLAESRAIWGKERLTLAQIIVRMGVDFGKLCRWERNADKDRDSHTETELKRHLGNLLLSLIRWCDDLGFNPEECLTLAKDSQKKFAGENLQR